MVRRLMLRLLGLACVGIVAACQTTAPPTESATIAANAGVNLKGTAETSRGERALAAGQLEAAREAFSAALRQDPNNVAAGIGMAETYLALGDRGTALRVFDSVSRWAQGVETARISQGRGLIALHDEDLPKARRQLTSAVDVDPSLWRAWVGLGRIHARAKEFNSARIAFARAEANATDLATVMNDIGMSYLMEREPRDAIGFFERALVVNPGLGVARGNLRIARAMDRQYEAAVAGASPDQLADALNNVGYIAVVNGDFEVADTYLRRALEVSPVYHEAAVANLNLLAHAQASGERPSVTTNLSRARSQPTVAAAEPAVANDEPGVAVAKPTVANDEPTGAAVTGDVGRLAATSTADTTREFAWAPDRPDPARTEVNRSFRWEEEKPVQAQAATPQRAAAIDAAASGEVSFRWADPATGPNSTSRDKVRRQAVQSEGPVADAAPAPESTPRQSDTPVANRRVGPVEFKWADPTAPLTGDSNS